MDELDRPRAAGSVYLATFLSPHLSRVRYKRGKAVGGEPFGPSGFHQWHYRTYSFFASFTEEELRTANATHLLDTNRTTQSHLEIILFTHPCTS